MRPVEINVSAHRDFDDFDPAAAVVAFEVILEQFHIIFANRRSEQLAKVGLCVVQVPGREDLVRVENPADPDLL